MNMFSLISYAINRAVFDKMFVARATFFFEKWNGNEQSNNKFCMTVSLKCGECYYLLCIYNNYSPLAYLSLENNILYCCIVSEHITNFFFICYR